MKEAMQHLVTVFALTVAAVGQQLEFDGDDAQQWARALMIDEETAIPRLAAGSAAAVPMLQALLADERKGVQEGVAMVCQRIGEPALSLGPALLQQLRDSELHTTRVQAARALAAIGDRRPEVLDALLDVMFTPEPDVVILRNGVLAGLLDPFGAALEKLTGDAVTRVLRAIDADRADSPEHAARVVDQLGDGAVAPLIAALDEEDRRFGQQARQAARASLLHRGWRTARRLERAGHPALAEQALHAGSLTGLDWLGLYDVEQRPAVPMSRLPDIRWQTAGSRGATLTLWRAAERPQGFVVERLLVTVPGKGSPTVAATSAVLPRALANDAMRAVGRVLSSTLTLRERRVIGFSVDETCSSMLLTLDDTTLLDETFAGSPSSDNLPQRFRLEATAHVLDDLLRDAEWQPRDHDDDDRAQLRAALARPDAPPWLKPRLHALADALGVAHD